MGLINWLLGKGGPAAQQQASTRPTQTDIHATLADATRPFAGGKPAASSSASAVAGSPAQRLEQRRSERNVRRELLFQVVRESMVRVGVLSSAFKFKVLALDQRGRTFLVMIDLSAEFAGETAKLAEIEALIAQSAKNRYELVVQAVYWRFYESVSTGAAQMGASSAPTPLFGMNSHTSSRPAPLSELPYPPVPARAPLAQPTVTARTPLAQPAPAARPSPSASATLVTRPAPSPLAKPTASQAVAMGSKTGADPLEQDEVEAFKRALASGAQPGMSIPLGRTPASANAYATTQAYPSPHAAANATALAAAAKAASLAAINNKLLLTGYEDTELPDPDAPVLSTTQYGELR
jgi:hypothetical protein